MPRRWRHLGAHRNFFRARLSGRDLERDRRTKRFSHRGLIGGTLGLMERRPALAGVCLGLLTYKPQFGLLFPLVLIADRRWRTIAVAAPVAAALAALSWPLSAARAGRRSCTGCRSQATIVLGEGAPTLVGCKAFSVWSAPTAAASRWPGPCRRGSSQSPPASLAVAKPRAVRAQGRGAGRRHAARHALCLYVRPGRAGGRGGLPAALRA